jgi:hypothetical protein
MGLYKDLKHSINCHGWDSRLNLSDETIAAYLMQCLSGLERVWEERKFNGPEVNEFEEIK